MPTDPLTVSPQELAPRQAEVGAAEAPTLAGLAEEATGRAPPAIVGYELLEELGRGGMGVVYKARQVKANRLVALKMVLSGGQAGPDDLARFRTEAEAVARLQHPHVVQVFEVGEHQGLPFFSLEFCPGGSLDRKLDGTPWQPAEAAGLVEALARAMHAAHQRGIIHRDLKPANVLLAEDGTAKVADFGLARKLDEQGRTQTGAVLGTPSYMAPEQAGASKGVGPAADTYALGAVLYELLVGRPPFKGPTPLDTVLQVVSEEPVAVRRLQPKVPRDLETICLKCLEKDPKKRYSSALALAEDLQRFRLGEAVHARPVGALGRAVRWARRRPAVATLAVLSVLAPLSLLVLGLVYNARLQQEQVALERQQREVKVSQEAAALERAAARAANARASQLLVNLGGLRLSALSSKVLPDNPGLALLLAVEGAERGRPPEGAQSSALLAALEKNRELHTFGTDVRECESAALSADRRWLAVSAGPDLRVWDVSDPWDPRQVWKAAGFPWTGSFPIGLSTDGRWVARRHMAHRQSGYADGSTALFTDRVVHVWDRTAGAKRRWLLVGHGDRVSAAAFSPDSRYLLTGSWDGTTRLWELATGKTTAVLGSPGNAVAAVLFTPDGRGALSVSHGVGLRSPLPANFKPDITDPLEYQDRPSTWSNEMAAQNAAGRRPDDGVFARLWDLPPAKERAAFVWSNERPPASTFKPTSAAFSGDGRRVAFGFELGGQRAGLWDCATGLPVRLFDIDWPVSQVALSRDGRRLLTASGNKWQVWDTTDGRRLGGQQTSTSWSWFAFRLDGRQVAAGDGSVVRAWDSESAQEAFVLKGHQADVRFLAYATDGERLVTAGDTSARLWNAGPEPSPLPTLRLHGRRALDAAYSPDGKRVAAGTTDKDGVLWDPATGAQTPLRPDRKAGTLTLPDEIFGNVTGVAFSPDGRRVLTLAQDEPARLNVDLSLGGLLPSSAADLPHQPVRLWDAADGKLLLALTGHTDRVKEARLSGDGSRVLTISEGRSRNQRAVYDRLGRRAGTVINLPRDVTCRVWDAATGKELAALPMMGSLQPPRCTAALSPDGTKLFVADQGRQRLLDVARSREIWSTALQVPLIFAEFSSDGGLILAYNDPYHSKWTIPDYWKVLTWDAANGRVSTSQTESTPPTAAHFRPGTHQVVWALNTGQWRLADLDQGKILHSREAHARAVKHLEFSPDGRRFVTVSEDRTARVWDADSGAELLTLSDSGNAVLRAHFRPDGAELLTVAEDGVVRLLPIDQLLPFARAHRPRALTAQERERYGVQEVSSSP
jgi:WD40 repeat protein/tRNA A-37 threonylcarbamoyl transferase component Bud32